MDDDDRYSTCGAYVCEFPQPEQACLAFIVDNSPGATHCVTAAREAGIPTVYLSESTSDSEEAAP